MWTVSKSIADGFIIWEALISFTHSCFYLVLSQWVTWRDTSALFTPGPPISWTIVVMELQEFHAAITVTVWNAICLLAVSYDHTISNNREQTKQTKNKPSTSLSYKQQLVFRTFISSGVSQQQVQCGFTLQHCDWAGLDLNDEVCALSSPSVHLECCQVGQDNGPAPLERSLHTVLESVVPETC